MPVIPLLNTTCARYQNIKLVTQPGQVYEYSNSDFVTLGMIIQAVSGQSYESYVTEHIFKPLDMQNSFASKTEAQQHGLAGTASARYGRQTIRFSLVVAGG